MGASDFPGGVGPMGSDPVAPFSPPTKRAPTPAAIQFNPTTGRFVMGSDGRFVEAHPVDQLVSILLGLPVKSHKSAPTTGHTLRDLPGAGAPWFEAEANDRIKAALSKPLLRGDIVIDSIVVNAIVDGPLKGRNEFVVGYYNLRSKQPDKLRTIKGSA
jgi:hypothetical protein